MSAASSSKTSEPTILTFGDKLARRPEAIVPDDVEELREVGLSDKEIVYIAQISASFAY